MENRQVFEVEFSNLFLRKYVDKPFKHTIYYIQLL